MRGGRCLGVFLVLLSCLVVAPPAAAELSLDISQTTTPGEYEFSARGFRDAEDVATWVTGPIQQVMGTGNHATDDKGRVKFRLRMPRHFQPGRWAITLHGLETGREIIGYFEVAVRGPDATLLVTPGSVARGETITVTGTGYGRGQRVAFWFTRPDGSTVAGTYILLANNEGNIAFIHTFLADTMTGGWALSAYSLNEDHLGVATFEIR
jgi:hypothetical protein